MVSVHQMTPVLTERQGCFGKLVWDLKTREFDWEQISDEPGGDGDVYFI